MDHVYALLILYSPKGLAPKEPAKAVMFGICLVTSSPRARRGAVALHDCDITTYKREMLARLIYPVANPSLAINFVKDIYVLPTAR